MEENKNQSPSENQHKIIVQDKYPESELTGKIIGCAMEVHKILGNGFTHLFNLFLMVFVIALQFKK